MLTIVKLLLSGSTLVESISLKISAVRRAAGAVAGLAVGAILLFLIGLGAAAAALFLGLEPEFGGVQAALMVCAAYLLAAAACALLTMRTARRALETPRRGAGYQRKAATAPAARKPAEGVEKSGGFDAAANDLPTVVGALFVGALVGRHLMKNKR